MDLTCAEDVLDMDDMNAAICETMLKDNQKVLVERLVPCAFSLLYLATNKCARALLRAPRTLNVFESFGRVYTVEELEATLQLKFEPKFEAKLGHAQAVALKSMVPHPASLEPK